jgi:FAD/FMN-containing dehydrogenase
MKLLAIHCTRRRLLQTATVAVSLPPSAAASLAPATVRAEEPARLQTRLRPGDPDWPLAASWEQLNQEVDGQLIKVHWPLEVCQLAPSSPVCAQVFKQLKNPYYLGDEVGLTQTLGWLDAWSSQPSIYAVAAHNTKDVVATVNFARKHNLRLVVKGGGHSYQGTSNAADSVLISTRRMNAVSLHDAFIPTGCDGPPQAAVTIEAGAIWGHVYDAVTTKAGRYVQGGGCMTVGVAGLIQSGGFGSFSKAYGMAAASLLQAEVVTADGAVRIANSCTHPDLFWAIKGGGGGSFGVVTRLTVRTHSLPDFFGAVFATIQATSDRAFRELIGKIVAFYAEALFNPHWGEQISFRPNNVLTIAMVFQGLTQQQAEAIWRPFFDWLAGSPQQFSFVSKPLIMAVPARHFWDPAILKQVPGTVLFDDRPGAPESNAFWAGNLQEAGQVLQAYQSAWLPARLLQNDRQGVLAEALFAACRHWAVSLHINKGLAGAPTQATEAAKDTATNPAVIDAFALLISAAAEPPAYPGLPGHQLDVATGRQHAVSVQAALTQIRKLLPSAGSYVSEADFFQSDWQDAYWGPNYPRLLAVKDKYDPDGLFYVHHGVGSERWSNDGFSRLR